MTAALVDYRHRKLRDVLQNLLRTIADVLSAGVAGAVEDCSFVIWKRHHAWRSIVLFEYFGDILADV